MVPREKDGVSRRANCSWVTGDELYLCRVKPSPSTINNIDSYEFFGGHNDSGAPIWSSSFSDIQPLVSWKGKMGSATITYNPVLKKYLMCVTDGWPTIKDMDSYILESDTIAGPWRMVQYMEAFGPQAYFLNFPGKFISDNKAWLCYSANFAYNKIRMDENAGNPVGSRYGMCLQEVEFLRH